MIQNSNQNKIPQGKQSKFGLIAFGAVAASMFFTNPSQSDYVDYAAEQLMQTARKDLCTNSNQPINSDVIVSFNFSLGEVCSTIIGASDFVGRGLLKGAIQTTTNRQNLGLFSIYTTQFPGKTYKTIGVLGNFVTFYAR